MLIRCITCLTPSIHCLVRSLKGEETDKVEYAAFSATYFWVFLILRNSS